MTSSLSKPPEDASVPAIPLLGEEEEELEAPFVGLEEDEEEEEEEEEQAGTVRVSRISEYLEVAGMWVPLLGIEEHECAPPISADPQLGPHVLSLLHMGIGAEWATRAKCRDMREAMFFGQGSSAGALAGRLICMGCDVRLECLASALDTRTDWGMWGGMTERERGLLLRQRPDIGSWKKALLG